MLSSISPLGERARNSRWAVVAAAYLLSSAVAGTLMGALLGAAGSLLPAPLRGSSITLAVLACVCLAGLVLDLRAGGHAVPSWRRQVDEGWIGAYRGWVTGTGFGFQLGLGIVTIVTSTTTYAVLVLEVLSGRWWSGALIGLCFGLVRALPLLLVRRIQTPEALHRLFRRLDVWARPMDRVAEATLALTALALLLTAVGAAPWT